MQRSEPNPPSLWRRVCGPALVLLATAGPLRAEGIQSRWERARRDGSYQEPGRDELNQAERLFKQTLAAGDDVSELVRAWKELGFDLAPVSHKGADVLVLEEAPARKTGRGFYVFRRSRSEAIALEAPHSWNDLHTGPIAFRLFEEAPIKAGAWNTVTRKEGDLAHVSSSYFQAFTRAFGESYRTGLVVQLHGFEAAKRTGKVAEEADAVVSGGTRTPPGWLLDLGKRMKEKWTERARLYPQDVHELGGTTNVQGQMLRSLGNDGFLHLEMALGLRKRMREEPTLRDAFLKCLLETYRKDRETER
jgi:hypothetical protein